jgi:F-type H+-transporting ATPase subunit epsilon
MGFPLQVVTPERVLFETEADALVLRSSSGDMTVLDGHTALVAAVVPGVVRIDREEGEPVRLAVHGGFLQVDTVPDSEGPSGLSTRVALLAGVAEPVTEIDVERARRARERAEAELGELRSRRTDEGQPAAGGEEEVVLGAIRRAELRLEAAGAPVEAIR